VRRRPGPVKAERSEPKGSLDGWTRCAPSWWRQWQAPLWSDIVGSNFILLLSHRCRRPSVAPLPFASLACRVATLRDARPYGRRLLVAAPLPCGQAGACKFKDVSQPSGNIARSPPRSVFLSAAKPRSSTARKRSSSARPAGPEHASPGVRDSTSTPRGVHTTVGGPGPFSFAHARERSSLAARGAASANFDLDFRHIDEKVLATLKASPLFGVTNFGSAPKSAGTGSTNH